MQNFGIKIDPVQSRALSVRMEQAKGFMTVTFLKKDGVIRKMNCLMHVTKHLKGGESKLNAEQYVTVWDVTKRAYRAINRETILEVRGV